MEKVIKRAVEPVKEAFRNPNIEIMPPTTLYIPKSSTPRVRSTIRDVYNDTPM